MNKTKEKDLELLGLNIRRHALEMTSSGGSSHIGSILSIADILAALYGSVLNIDPNNPKDDLRDRFILSKGHAGAGVYAALAEKGFFKKDMLAQHYQNGSKLSGHVSHVGIPGVELSTGSLGHGLSVGCGMALRAKLDDLRYRVFVLLSDGECDEGSNWEAILFAGHHRLSNLIAVIDYNHLQSIKSTDETLSLEPFADKWKAFGWNVVQIDGHDYKQLVASMTKSDEGNKPSCIIANTIKGKGISFMENAVLWHYRSPQGEELKAARTELERGGVK